MVKYKNQNDRYDYFAVFVDIFTQFYILKQKKTLIGYEMVIVLEKNFKYLRMNLKLLEMIQELNI